MAQDSLQCLAQLASMHGPIFPDESAQVSYLAHLVEGLLSMINGSVPPNQYFVSEGFLFYKMIRKKRELW